VASLCLKNRPKGLIFNTNLLCIHLFFYSRVYIDFGSDQNLLFGQLDNPSLDQCSLASPVSRQPLIDMVAGFPLKDCFGVLF